MVKISLSKVLIEVMLVYVGTPLQADREISPAPQCGIAVREKDCRLVRN